MTVLKKVISTKQYFFNEQYQSCYVWDNNLHMINMDIYLQLHLLVEQ